MNNEEFLSSEFVGEVENSEDVETPISSENVPLDALGESSEIIEEDVETSEENNEISEESLETSTEVIYQVADLTKVENSLGIITCFVIFFSVYFLGSMVYRLVKDIFY